MRRFLFAAVAASSLLFACTKEVYVDDIHYQEHYLMTITNKSNAPVVCLIPAKGSLPAPGKDGGLPSVLSEREKESAVVIPAKSFARITVIEDEATDILEEYGIDDSVQFFFFDKDVFGNTPWEEILAGELWLAKYSFTAKQLIDAGKSIVYPQVQKK